MPPSPLLVGTASSGTAASGTAASGTAASGTAADPVDIVSGEGVRLGLARAGLGSRTLAAAIDLAVQVAALSLLAPLVLLAAGDEATFAASSIVLLVVVLVGYPVVTEWATRGRTIGKLCLGLRVVRVDGGPVGFRHALVRGLAGLVLEKPGVAVPVLGAAAGAATVAIGRRDQRLGDLLAGTVVLDERAAPQPAALPWAWVPPPLQPWVLSLDLSRLDNRFALLLRTFVTRAHAMDPAAQRALGDELYRRVVAVVTPPPPTGAPVPDVLTSVLAERRRRALAAVVPGAAPGAAAVPVPSRPAPRPAGPFAPPA